MPYVGFKYGTVAIEDLTVTLDEGHSQAHDSGPKPSPSTGSSVCRNLVSNGWRDAAVRRFTNECSVRAFPRTNLRLRKEQFEGHSIFANVTGSSYNHFLRPQRRSTSFS